MFDDRKNFKFKILTKNFKKQNMKIRLMLVPYATRIIKGQHKPCFKLFVLESKMTMTHLNISFIRKSLHFTQNAI